MASKLFTFLSLSIAGGYVTRYEAGLLASVPCYLALLGFPMVSPDISRLQWRDRSSIDWIPYEVLPDTPHLI